MKDFMVETYKEFEAKAGQFARFKASRSRTRRRPTPRPRTKPMPRETSPLSGHESLNMHETGGVLRPWHQDHEEEHDPLGRGARGGNQPPAGRNRGFCSQLKSCFARSTVVFLEQEDPSPAVSRRLIFSINLPNYELKSSMQEGMGQGNCVRSQSRRLRPVPMSQRCK